MVTCCILYTLDPHELAAFEDYATRWPPIIERSGGALLGYWLTKEGANDFALALIEFASLAEYERYRKSLAADPDAQQNVADVRAARAIVAERRSFLRRV